MRESWFIQAPAKLNLALAVGPADLQVEDSRHPICTWMVGISLCDDLTLTPLEEGFFSRYAVIWHKDAQRRPEIDWSITKDLAVRAHLLLEEHVGRRLPVQVKLEKRIPAGAGLGGGSSDAAAMLRACNRVFNLDLSHEALVGLAAQIGSDVPFFLEAADTGEGLCSGFGERIERVSADRSIEETRLVLFIPEFECRTADVYRGFDEYADRLGGQAGFAERGERARNLARTGATGPDDPFNDLADAAANLQPQLASLQARLVELTELPMHMTGSGSALFAICSDALHAEFLAKAVEEACPEVVSLPVSPHIWSGEGGPLAPPAS